MITLIGVDKAPRLSPRAPVVVDADIPLYRACQGAETEVDWSPEISVMFSEPKVALNLFDSIIDQYLLSIPLKKRAVVLALSSPSNWRKKVDPTYKSNRIGSRKPMCFRAVRASILSRPNAVMIDDLEGDDILGSFAKPNSRLIVSEDKDLKGVPGFLFNPRTKEHTYTSELEANRFWMTQALSGDPSDGYYGCDGIGPVTARKILDGATSLEEMVNRVIATFESKGQDRKTALTQMVLSRIVRFGEDPHSEGWAGIPNE